MFVHFTDQGGASSPSRIEEHREEAKRARPCEPVKEIRNKGAKDQGYLFKIHSKDLNLLFDKEDEYELGL